MKNTLDKSKSPPPTQNPRAESLTLEDYRTFFESLDKNAISSATNAKGDIIYANDKFVEVSQYSREELLGQNHRIIKSGFHPPEFYKELWKTIASGRVWRGEIKNKAKDGTYYWVDSNIWPILGAEGKPAKYVSVRFLITEQKRVEGRLKAAKTYAENIIGTVREPLIVLSKALRVVSANRSFYTNFHVKPEETEGRLIYDLGNRQWNIPKLRTLLEEILPCSNSLQDFEVQHNFETIGQKTMLLNARKIIQEEEEELILLAFEDITERKELEKLLVRKEELEKSIKELDSFAYSVSHDLKAPLRGIGQVVDWFHNDFIDKLNDEQKENMNLLERRVGRMNGLIDGILRYSRLGRGGEVKEKIAFEKLVSDVVDSLQPPENIKVKVEGTLPTLSCVYVQMEQVFQNLISNAIHYMDKKNGEIKIGCRDKNFEWVFYVEDNGPGIAKEHFERIFQIFQTLNPRDEVEATGIGLSIVKKLVELNNGCIWLESEMGKGSTFFFSLPKG